MGGGLSTSRFCSVVAISVLRVGLVVAASPYLLQVIDYVISLGGPSSRISAALLLSAAMVSQPGMATLLHFLRMWILRRAKDPWDIARWRVARIDIFLAPVILLTLVLLHWWFAVAASVVFAIGSAVSLRQTRISAGSWPTDLIQIGASIIVGGASLFLGYLLLVAGQVSIAAIVVSTGLIVWLWLIAILGWQKPLGAVADPEIF